MRLMQPKRYRQCGGFTLIEMLVVIVILGVIAAIIVLALRGVTDRGEASACASSENAVVVASEAFFAQQGIPPADVELLLTGPEQLLNLGPGATVDGNVVTGKEVKSTQWMGVTPWGASTSTTSITFIAIGD